jgi:acyl carrier protein
MAIKVNQDVPWIRMCPGFICWRMSFSENPMSTFSEHALKNANQERSTAVLDRTNDATADRVAALVRKALDKESIDKPVVTDDDLRASGLSSLGLVNLMLSVETEFDLTFTERDMTPANFRSIARIVELVRALSA